MAEQELVNQGQAVADTAPEGAGEATGREQAKRQSDYSNVNIDDLPQGRALKSSYDKQLAALRKEMEMERLGRLQAERARDSAYLEGKPEIEQMEYKLKQAYQTIQDMERKRQEELNDLRKQSDIERLAMRSGAPKDKLSAFESYDEAVDFALEYAVKRREEATRQLVDEEYDKEIRNDVDTGSGRPPPPKDTWEEERQRLIAAGDSVGLVKHLMAGRPPPGD